MRTTGVTTIALLHKKVKIHEGSFFPPKQTGIRPVPKRDRKIPEGSYTKLSVFIILWGVNNNV